MRLAKFDSLLRVAICKEIGSYPYTVSLVCPIELTSADKLYYSRLYSDELINFLVEELRTYAAAEEKKPS